MILVAQGPGAFFSSMGGHTRRWGGRRTKRERKKGVGTAWERRRKERGGNAFGEAREGRERSWVDGGTWETVNPFLSKSGLRGDQNIPNMGGCQGALAGTRLPARRVLCLFVCFCADGDPDLLNRLSRAHVVRRFDLLSSV